MLVFFRYEGQNYQIDKDTAMRAGIVRLPNGDFVQVVKLTQSFEKTPTLKVKRMKGGGPPTSPLASVSQTVVET